jgi:hypothetical protein
MKMFRRAIPDGSARVRSLLSPVDDSAIELLRRLTLRLGVITAAVAVLGLPVTFLAVGVVRRTPSISPEEWTIALFWAVLLGVAIVRRANWRAVLVIGVALVASAVYGFVTGLH